MTIMFFIKYIGTSSPKKLRWIIYYTLYVMDPNKNILKHVFLHSDIKHNKITKISATCTFLKFNLCAHVEQVIVWVVIGQFGHNMCVPNR